jgi:uncharacterized membrane protein YcaP (DUF421 family)
VEIVVRAAAVYLFLWFVTRAIGKRELGEMSAFELVLLVCMGDLIQQGVMQEDYSVTGASLAVATFALMLVFFSWVSWRFRGTRPLLEGAPTVVVLDGQVLEAAMRYERLSDTELQEGLREQGIGDLRDVRVGILEPDGKLSFIRSRT